MAEICALPMYPMGYPMMMPMMHMMPGMMPSYPGYPSMPSMQQPQQQPQIPPGYFPPSDSAALGFPGPIYPLPANILANAVQMPSAAAKINAAAVQLPSGPSKPAIPESLLTAAIKGKDSGGNYLSDSAVNRPPVQQLPNNAYGVA